MKTLIKTEKANYMYSDPTRLLAKRDEEMLIDSRPQYGSISVFDVVGATISKQKLSSGKIVQVIDIQHINRSGKVVQIEMALYEHKNK